MPSPGDRRPTVWTRPPEFEPGWTSAFLILVPHSQLGPAPKPGGVAGDILWIPDPGVGMDSRFYFLIAAPGVEPPNEWPGKESMGSRLIERFALANEETLWIVVQDTPIEGNNEQVLENYKKGMLEQADLPAELFETPGVLRGYVFGDMSNGTRLYIDLHVPEPSSI